MLLLPAKGVPSWPPLLCSVPSQERNHFLCPPRSGPHRGHHCSADQLLDPSGPCYRQGAKVCAFMADAVTPLVQRANNTYGSYLRPPKDAQLGPAELNGQHLLLTSYTLLRRADRVSKVRAEPCGSRWHSQETGRQAAAWEPNAFC